jgi:LysR family transcriptional regulator, hydrogen peroxide-inducible genes activator
MELRQMEYFVAVVETGSFSAAAERCNIAQPSLSQQIIKLEHEIGQQLFNRLGRTITLTDVGKTLYPHAQAILSNVQQAYHAVKSGYYPEKGMLSMGIIPTLGLYVLHDAIVQFKERYPEARLTILEDTTDVLLRKVLNAELDVCYVSLPIEQTQLASEKLFVEPLFVAVSAANPVAKGNTISASILKDIPFIQLTDKHCLSAQIDAFCYIQQIDPLVMYHTSQLATALEFVRLGMGISLVPACAAWTYPHDDVKFLSIEDNRPTRVIVAVRHRVRPASVLDSGFTAIFAQVWKMMQFKALASIQKKTP